MTQYAVTPLGHTLLIPEQRRAERRSIGAIGDHAVQLLTAANARIAELEEQNKHMEAVLYSIDDTGPPECTYTREGHALCVRLAKLGLGIPCAAIAREALEGK